MIVTPLEEYDTKRWDWYQKEILEATMPVKKLIKEFNEWAEHMQEKYLKDRLTDKQREELMHRVTEDGKYIISLDIEKLLGKK